MFWLVCLHFTQLEKVLQRKKRLTGNEEQNFQLCAPALLLPFHISILLPLTPLFPPLSMMCLYWLLCFTSLSTTESCMLHSCPTLLIAQFEGRLSFMLPHRGGLVLVVFSGSFLASFFGSDTLVLCIIKGTGAQRVHSCCCWLSIALVCCTIVEVCPAGLLNYAKSGVCSSEHLASGVFHSIGGLLGPTVHPEDASHGH